MHLKMAFALLRLKGQSYLKAPSLQPPEQVDPTPWHRVSGSGYMSFPKSQRTEAILGVPEPISSAWMVQEHSLSQLPLPNHTKDSVKESLSQHIYDLHHPGSPVSRLLCFPAVLLGEAVIQAGEGKQRWLVGGPTYYAATAGYPQRREQGILWPHCGISNRSSWLIQKESA